MAGLILESNPWVDSIFEIPSRAPAEEPSQEGAAAAA
jgi:hypothetical protein